MTRLLLALALLLLAPSAEARPGAYQSFNVAGRGGASWQGYSPAWISGLKLWLRADLGITMAAGPVVATGTTPPTVTLAGTPTSQQTSQAVPYVELDCTTLGILGTSRYTVKVNGATTATNVASASSGVVVTGSGLTAGWAAGASAVDDVYKSNIVASAWADQSTAANNGTQATAAKQPVVAGDTAYGGQASVAFVSASSKCLTMGATFIAQPYTIYIVGESTSGATQQEFYGDATKNVTGPYFNSATWNLFGGSTLSTASATRAPGIFAAIFNSTASSIYLSAATAANSGAAGANNATGTQAIGSQACTGSFLNGKIAEMVQGSGAEDPSVVWRQLTYESNRFGLTLAK